MLPYQNKILPPRQRAEDLLSRMSDEEKLTQLQCVNPANFFGKDMGEAFPRGVGHVSCLMISTKENPAAVAEWIRELQEKFMALSPHRIPALFHCESLTGLLMHGAAAFPSGIGQGATWNPELEEKMAGIIADQAVSVGLRHALGPVFDISRDPRFGRQGETYGEDPTLAAAMGTAYVRGLQDRGMMATSKHFLAFQASIGGIHGAACPVSPRQLREVYAKPFQAAITQGHLGAVMNAYGTIDGEPVAGSKAILKDLLRDEMQFEGLTVSDYCAVMQLHTNQRVAKSKAEAGLMALEAGMDVELPGPDSYTEELLAYFKEGKADMKTLDDAVLRVLTAKFALGLFENPFPLGEAAVREAYAASVQETALQTARESLVLMKNDGILPLDIRGKKVAVIGHHAASSRALFGGYSYLSMKETMLGIRFTMAGIEVDESAKAARAGENNYPGSIVNMEHPGMEDLAKAQYPGILNLLEALQEACPEADIQYAYGYPYIGDDESHFEEALQLAKNADVVLLTLGGKYGWNTSSTMGEGIDATNINLPPCQESFLKQLAKLHKPTVAVHFDGRPISSDMADQSINGILEAFSPGQQGAKAIVEALMGTYNPGGKLPVTVARNAGQIPIFYAHEHGSSYHEGESIGFQSYVDGPHTPRYCFGHGLSYTAFAYSNLALNKTAFKPYETMKISVDVKNTGDRPGDEVVQLYVKDEYATVARPVMELAGFKRVSLLPGETKTVSFACKMTQFAFLDQEMKWKVEKGDMQAMVGGGSDDIRLAAPFEISSDAWVDGASRGFYAETEIR